MNSADGLMRVGAMVAGLEDGARLQRISQRDALKVANATLRGRVASLRSADPVESSSGAAVPQQLAELRQQTMAASTSQDVEYGEAVRARDFARDERRRLEEAAEHNTRSLAADLRKVATSVRARTAADASNGAHESDAAIAAWEQLESSMQKSAARIAAAEAQLTAARNHNRSLLPSSHDR